MTEILDWIMAATFGDWGWYGMGFFIVATIEHCPKLDNHNVMTTWNIGKKLLTFSERV